MNVSVIKFFERYNSDPELRAKVKAAEDMYPGSLEIRDALVEAVLLPFADELGLSFTVEDLKEYESRLRAERHKNVELSEDELAQDDIEEDYWLENRGWTNDESQFCGD